MQDMRKPAILVALLSAVGIGCYTWGQHQSADSTATATTPYPTAAQLSVVRQPIGNAPAAMNPASMADQTDQTNSASPTRNVPGSPNVTSRASAVPIVSGAPLTQMNQNAAVVPGVAPAVQGRPVTSMPYAGTTTVTPVSTTVVERKTVVTPTTHTAYTQRSVQYKHHQRDKVHIARATKHGVMFALKLPGRAAL
jgi:hypothetical protein